MEIKPIKLKGKTLPNNIFLAPMAGYTDYAFRNLEVELGVGLSFTELVSAKGLVYGGNGSKQLLFCGDKIKSTAVQIFGGDPFYMRSACESDDLKDFDTVDINMGCPVPKVYKNGEGCALLNDIVRAEKIVRECVKSGKIITVKIRTGLTYGDDVATDFALMAENAGASLISIHGRVREAYYSGEPDFNAIYKAKKSVSIPVIANGGIFSQKDADEMIEKTGADGVMLARGAVENPFLVCSLLNKRPDFDLKTFVLRQLQDMVAVYGEKRATLEFKKFVPYYLKGTENAKRDRLEVMSASRFEDIIASVNKIF